MSYNLERCEYIYIIMLFVRTYISPERSRRGASSLLETPNQKPHGGRGTGARTGTGAVATYGNGSFPNPVRRRCCWWRTTTESTGRGSASSSTSSSPRGDTAYSSARLTRKCPPSPSATRSLAIPCLRGCLIGGALRRFCGRITRFASRGCSRLGN